MSCVVWDWVIDPTTPPQSLRDSINSGMIATGNHRDFDSLRGAQPQRESQGVASFIREGTILLTKADNLNTAANLYPGTCLHVPGKLII